MKLNIDCVRDVLLELESFPMGSCSIKSFENSINKYGRDDVAYTLMKLIEAKYINAEYQRSITGSIRFMNFYDMTFQGHEFLEKIRSDTIWNQKLKPAFSSFGSMSFDVISSVASAVITSLISGKLGL